MRNLILGNKGNTQKCEVFSYIKTFHARAWFPIYIGAIVKREFY